MATSVTTTDGVLIVVKDSDATHSDPTKDQRGCYKRGDPVQVFPGTKPLVLPPAPPFYIVRVVDVTYEQAKKFEDSWVDAQHQRLVRRLYWCDLDQLSIGIRDELFADRYIEVTYNQVRNELKNKQTGGPAGP